jgi:predicted ATP-dependent protease
MSESNASTAAPAPLGADSVFRACDPERLGFRTTADIADVPGVVGQARAMSALEFGSRTRGRGFNLFVLGSPGSGRHRIVHDFMTGEAARRPVPSDWCYVNNFADPQKPHGISLPPGRGGELRHDMKQLVDDLQASVPAVFQSENFRDRLGEIEEEFQARNKQAMERLQKEAEEEGMGLLSTPQGFAIAPVRDGRVLSEEEFGELPEEERERAKQSIQRLTEKLRKHLQGLPVWHRERRQRIRELERDVVMLAVGSLIQDLKSRYEDIPAVQVYLGAVQDDVLENVQDFRAEGKGRGLPALQAGEERQEEFRRYQVNVVVDNAQNHGAPVVYESNPSYQNLVGRVEHVSQFGTLTTDFTMIRPGALHGARGGYLILDAERLLLQPFAWEALKRCLFGGEVRTESMAQMLSLISTQSLEPDPMPLEIKVVLIGNRLLYYLLCEFDQDFPELFKVAADFEDQMVRSEETTRLYARMLATVARQQGLLPFTAGAVARVIEHSARLVEDSGRLSTHVRSITDLMSEADFLAREADRSRVSREEVEQATERQISRLDRIRSRIYEAIEQDLILVETRGRSIGQVNALSVMQLGAFSFGQPSRVTATVRIGEGEVVDIEREVELGGAIHSKGVLILTSFLGSRYARDLPLSLHASLVFEQHYGGVEGDSASLAEVCALLSAIGGVPLHQSLAMTGSINQYGRVQSIGGVNEKIEGFFDICHRRGLSGEQGVLIPAENVRHLMLRRDVRESIAAGTFRVYPVRTVDEAMALLTGMEAGLRAEDGEFPADTVNGRVARALRELARRRQAFGAREGKGESGDVS